MKILEVTNDLIIDHRAREWCKLPYPNHPRGCPNYGKKYDCPPQVQLIENWLGDYKKLWLVCVSFDIESHAEEMLRRHPHWSDRQARCLLYWQPKVNKELARATWGFAIDRLNGCSYCPEAMGVDVIKTARLAGLPIETNPRKIVHKISLVKL